MVRTKVFLETRRVFQVVQQGKPNIPLYARGGLRLIIYSSQISTIPWASEGKGGPTVISGASLWRVPAPVGEQTAVVTIGGASASAKVTVAAN